MSPSDEFAAFFRGVHGYDPFPWQRRLVAAIAKDGWQHTSCDLPTSSGKTSFIDAAVFHLSLEAARPATERRAPIRIFFVIDRRVVVDEAFERARRIADALRAPSDPAVAAVAKRLKLLADADSPLECAVLRGGMYRDDSWVRSPRQPTVVVSTVDQVGSRLLFRGYGLRSGRTWPVHAGLTGHDALVILDEAHCSGAFVETLSAIERYRTWAEKPVPGPFHVVTMSATLQRSRGERFSLDENDFAHPVLAARLAASKPTRLLEAKGDLRRGALARALVDQASELAGEPRVIGVIVNRVATARDCLKLLRADGHDAILLTGRVRPFDRTELLDRHRAVLFASPERVRPDRPLFVVATQCIEVGANLDFDALVTECASLDALRQRFGRLNRLGRPEPHPGVIVTHEAAHQADDVVYGSSLPATRLLLTRLQEKGTLDFGVMALAKAVEGEPDLEACSKQVTAAPILMPAQLDLLCQTSPVPAADPEPAVFLHGESEHAPEVRVVWRSDLDGEGEDLEQGRWLETVTLLPPTSIEAMPLPIHAVRDWLTGGSQRSQSTDAGADLDTAGVEVPRGKQVTHECPPVLLWRGPDVDASEAVTRDARRIRPGDTIVVPTRYGGCDEFGWAPGPIPTSEEPVRDLGEVAHALRRGRVALRVTARTKPSDLSGATGDLWDEVTELTSPPDDPEVINELLESLSEDEAAPPHVATFAQLLVSDPGRQVLVHPAGGVVVTGRRRLDRSQLLAIAAAKVEESAAYDFVDEDDTSFVRTRDVSLASHSEGVRNRASAFAAAIGLAPELASDVALAAWLHDVGKIDPRFQAWLRAGDRLREPGKALAKAASLGLSRAQREAARRRSGYPAGGRHELLSVRLAESAPLGELADDPDLVLHLIAAHHGYCRPLAPVVHDPAPCAALTLEHDKLKLEAVSSATGLERLDSGLADRFWRLVRRYGWWGLAFLETVVRLADWRQSEVEDEDERPNSEAKNERTLVARA